MITDGEMKDEPRWVFTGRLGLCPVKTTAGPEPIIAARWWWLEWWLSLNIFLAEAFFYDQIPILVTGVIAKLDDEAEEEK